MRLPTPTPGFDESSMSTMPITSAAAIIATRARPTGLVGSGRPEEPDAEAFAAVPGAIVDALPDPRPWALTTRWIGVPLGTRLW